MMSGAQLLPCGKLQVLAETLKAVRKESNICMLSCLTNFLTRAEGSSQASLRVEPVLMESFQIISEASIARTDVHFLLCPPMYRTGPYWYREGMAGILTKFSDVMKVSSRPPNFHLMPSFPTPSFEADGVHLTAYSGLEFMLHLFDSAIDLVGSLELTTDDKSARNVESTRVLEDRVMALEQDHRRLSREVESKTLVDCELACFQENIRNEDCIVVSGLGRISSKLSPKDWQVKAMQDVRIVLSLLMGEEIPIVYVKNSTGSGKDAITTYVVKLANIQVSKEVRNRFAKFFTGGGDTRPPALKAISVRNCVTPATQVRISLLKLLGGRYVESNPGSRFLVFGYEPRPILKLFPAQDAADKRIQIYNYVDAVRTLPVNFSKAELDPILQKISSKLRGGLRQTFGVISDDMLPFKSRPKKSDHKGDQGEGSGANAGSGSGSGTSSRGGRHHKRGASSSPDAPTTKKTSK